MTREKIERRREEISRELTRIPLSDERIESLVEEDLTLETMLMQMEEER